MAAGIIKLRIAFIMLRDLIPYVGVAVWWYVGFLILRLCGVDVAPAAIWPVITVAVFMAMLAIGMMVSE